MTLRRDETIVKMRTSFFFYGCVRVYAYLLFSFLCEYKRRNGVGWDGGLGMELSFETFRFWIMT
jgi:hypothetical protein